MKSILIAVLVAVFFGGNAEAKYFKKKQFKGGDDDLFATVSLGSTNHVVGDNQNPDFYEEPELSFGVNFDYRFYKYLSVGVGYVDFGEAEQSTEVLGTEVEKIYTAGSGVTAALTWHTDIKDGPWYFYAKVGRIEWDTEIFSEITDTEDPAVFLTGGVSSSGGDLFTGFGGAYHIKENIRIGVNFEQYKMKYLITDPEDSTSDDYRHEFNQTSISLTYSF